MRVRGCATLERPLHVGAAFAAKPSEQGIQHGDDDRIALFQDPVENPFRDDDTGGLGHGPGRRHALGPVDQRHFAQQFAFTDHRDDQFRDAVTPCDLDLAGMNDERFLADFTLREDHLSRFVFAIFQFTIAQSVSPDRLKQYDD